jgi:hypothetical protein
VQAQSLEDAGESGARDHGHIWHQIS